MSTTCVQSKIAYRGPEYLTVRETLVKFVNVFTDVSGWVTYNTCTKIGQLTKDVLHGKTENGMSIFFVF